MDVALPYGTQTRIVTVPDDAVVVRSQPLPALVDAHQAAISHPIGTPALVDLVGPQDQVAIIISDLKTLLTDLHAAVHEWQQQGVRCMPSPEREDWLSQYFQILAQGYAT